MQNAKKNIKQKRKNEKRGIKKSLFFILYFNIGYIKYYI
nr:MAG TPA: hypothetical protein [Caudoviricetes sp.]